MFKDTQIDQEPYYTFQYDFPLKKMYHQLNDKKFAYMNTTFMACNNVYCSRETDKALKVQDFLRI